MDSAKKKREEFAKGILALEEGFLCQSRMTQKPMRQVLQACPTANMEMSPRRKSRLGSNAHPLPASRDSIPVLPRPDRTPLPPALTASDQVLPDNLESSSPLPPRLQRGKLIFFPRKTGFRDQKQTRCEGQRCVLSLLTGPCLAASLTHSRYSINLCSI